MPRKIDNKCLFDNSYSHYRWPYIIKFKEIEFIWSIDLIWNNLQISFLTARPLHTCTFRIHRSQLNFICRSWLLCGTYSCRFLSFRGNCCWTWCFFLFGYCWEQIVDDQIEEVLDIGTRFGWYLLIMFCLFGGYFLSHFPRLI